MPYIKKSITVQYEDNSYGKTEQKTQTFSGKDADDVLNNIEQWRHDGGYILKNKADLIPDNFTLESTSYPDE